MTAYIIIRSDIEVIFMFHGYIILSILCIIVNHLYISAKCFPQCKLLATCM